MPLLGVVSCNESPVSAEAGQEAIENHGTRLLNLANSYRSLYLYEKSREIPLAEIDSLFCLAEEWGREQQDTAFWIEALLLHAKTGLTKWEKKVEMSELALSLARNARNRKWEHEALVGLMGCYIGADNAKFRTYAEQRLHMLMDTLPEHSIYMNRATIYQYIGMKDSARYCRHMADSLSVVYKAEQKRRAERAVQWRNGLLLLAFLLAGAALCYTYCKLKRRERELQELKKRLEMLASESSVCTKIKQIINDFRQYEKSDSCMTDEDWRQLLSEQDAQCGGLLSRLHQQHNLSLAELSICCLCLLGIPASYQRYLLECSRDSVYRKQYAILERMGIPRKSIALKDYLNGMKSGKCS